MDEELKWSWLAGFWDGEGTIGMLKGNDKTYKSGYKYTPYISIVNTNLTVMLDIAKFLHFPEHRVVLINPARQDHLASRSWKPYCKILIRGSSNVFPILVNLIKYLRVKQKQAKVLLYYSYVTKERSFAELDNEDRELREYVWQTLKELNKKGI